MELSNELIRVEEWPKAADFGSSVSGVVEVVELCVRDRQSKMPIVRHRMLRFENALAVACFLERSHRVIVSTRCGIGEAEIDERHFPQARIEAMTKFHEFDCPFRAAAKKFDDTAAHIASCVASVELERRVERAHGLVIVAAKDMDEAAQLMGPGNGGIDRQRFVGHCLGLDHRLLDELRPSGNYRQIKGKPEADIGPGQFRIDIQGGLERRARILVSLPRVLSQMMPATKHVIVSD